MKTKTTQLRYLEGLKYVPMPIGAASVALSAAKHGVKWLSFNRATGGSITLPKANGKNPEFRLFIPQTLSGSLVIRSNGGTDIISGIANVQTTLFQSASNTNTVTLNGTTTGGVLGSYLIFNDMGAGQWLLEANLLGSGTAATPFSNT